MKPFALMVGVTRRLGLVLSATWAAGLAVQASGAAAATFRANGGIVFEERGGTLTELWLARPDASRAVRISHRNLGQYQQDPAFTRDGTRIAFTIGAPAKIFLMAADGTGVTQVTTGSAWDMHPSWSPDGSKIAFQRCSTVCRIYVVNADGTQLHLLRAVKRVHEQTPSWSPAGGLIAFAGQRFHEPCQRIWTVRASGTSAHILTPCRNPHQVEAYPTWSPDASHLAFQRTDRTSAATSIITMRRDGTHGHAIAQARRPEWSPDGTRILALGGRLGQQLIQMTPTGRDRILLRRGPSAAAWRPAACTVTGTSGNDLVVGTTGDDVICGFAGNDVIRGMGGDDVIAGGSGRDRVDLGWSPGPAAVVLALHATLPSGVAYLTGLESVVGTPGADTVVGDDGPNLIGGRAGNDQLSGGPGNDLLLGGPGRDALTGGPGHDTCIQNQGDIPSPC